MRQKQQILLGFEVGSGKAVEIEPDHLVATGLTHKSGKTTTLESLIKRGARKAIVFRTKVGEKTFLQGTIIPPYFKDRSDWEFIKGLVESTMKMKIDKFEQATIIQLCKQTGGNSLLDFKKKVDQKLTEKISASQMVTLTNLQAYLEKVVPKLQTIKFSNTLELVDGLNIIDLERFSRDPEVQGLIIASVLEEVLYNFKDVVVLIPEAWKFIPQDRGSPCKLPLEEFIKQGATNHNYIWIDSQDLSSVDKNPLKQISTWILGYQSEKNEVKHTLEQLPIPSSSKPKPDEIMSLGTGMFYLATREKTIKTYVLPFWLDDAKGIKIAKGELKIEDIDKPAASLAQNRILTKQAGGQADTATLTATIEDVVRKITKEMNELREDFFNKIAALQEENTNIHILINDTKLAQPQIDEDSIVGKVLQKMPVPKVAIGNGTVNIDSVVQEVLKRIPIGGGGATYMVEPLEKLKKEFQEEAKQKIISDINAVSPDAKRTLKYLEAKGTGAKTAEIVVKGFMLALGGSSQDKVNKAINELKSINVARKDAGGSSFGELKKRITELTSIHGATEQEVSQLYNHVVMELLGTS